MAWVWEEGWRAGNNPLGYAIAAVKTVAPSLLPLVGIGISLGVSYLRNNNIGSLIKANEWNAKQVTYYQSNILNDGLNGSYMPFQNPDPPYNYNGKSYESKSELYFSILLDKTTEQLGIDDALAFMGYYLGSESSVKRFQMKGASKGTSVLSETLGKSKREFEKQKWAPTLNNPRAGTKMVGRFFARWIPWVGAAYLAYDVGSILYNTQLTYNKIVDKK